MVPLSVLPLHGSAIPSRSTGTNNFVKGRTFEMEDNHMLKGLSVLSLLILHSPISFSKHLLNFCYTCMNQTCISHFIQALMANHKGKQFKVNYVHNGDNKKFKEVNQWHNGLVFLIKEVNQ